MEPTQHASPPNHIVPSYVDFRSVGRQLHVIEREINKAWAKIILEREKQGNGWIPDFDERETKWMHKPKPLLEIFERLKTAKKEEQERIEKKHTPGLALVHFLKLQKWDYPAMKQERDSILKEICSKEHENVQSIRFASWLQAILAPFFDRISVVNQCVVQHEQQEAKQRSRKA